MDFKRPNPVEKMMSSWPKAAKESARFMTSKYGPPAAMTNEMAVM